MSDTLDSNLLLKYTSHRNNTYVVLVKGNYFHMSQVEDPLPFFMPHKQVGGNYLGTFAMTSGQQLTLTLQMIKAIGRDKSSWVISLTGSTSYE